MLVIICWIAPVISVLAILGYDLKRNNEKQLNDNYIKEMEHGASTIMLLLNQAISSSREASYNSTLKKIYADYEITKNDLDLSQRTNAYLQTQYRYDPTFVTTILFYKNNENQHFYTYNATESDSYAGYILYKRIHERVVEKANALDTNIGFVNDGGRLYLVRNIVDGSFEPYATLVMELNTEYIFSTFTNLAWQNGIYINVNGEDYYIGEEIEFSKPPFVDYYKMPPELYKTETGEIGFFGREIRNSMIMEYVVMVDDANFFEKLLPYSPSFFILVLFLAVLLIYVLYFAYKNIFNPMTELIKTTKIIEDGNFGYQTDFETHNSEFDELRDSINHMSLRLEEQFKKIYSKELASRDARIMALQSQINPHFLNNTLEIINWEARIAGNKKISNMIEALSVMFEALTDRQDISLVSLEQELEYVDAYLYIVATRFGNQLTVDRIVDPSLLNCKVPKLILQPLVENAVTHGRVEDKPWEIIIGAFKTKDYLIIEIMNDNSLSEENKKQIKALLSDDVSKEDYSTKMGIFNVNSRLNIIYNKKGFLKIEGNKTHTISTVYIPIEKEDDTKNED